MGQTASQCESSEPLTSGITVGLALQNTEPKQVTQGRQWMKPMINIPPESLVKYRYNQQFPPDEPWRLFRTDIDAHMLGTLCAELVVSVGGLIDARWAMAGRTTCGPTCDAQGALAQVGMTATSIFMMAIAVQTWRCLFIIGTKPYSVLTWVSVAIATWGFIGLFAVIGWPLHPNFYEPAPLWCWISAKYPLERPFGQYLAFGNTFVYVPLYLFSGGNLHYTGGANDNRLEWTWSPQVPENVVVENQRSEA